MADYEFVTLWRFKAPQEKVWDLIFHSENWPEWWRGVEKVEKLKDGDANHTGAIHRYTWKSKLPYHLVFEMETTRVEPISLIEGRAIGELQGVGRWQLSNDGKITSVRYDWKVETTKTGEPACALARPLFSWNMTANGWSGESGETPWHFNTTEGGQSLSDLETLRLARCFTLKAYPAEIRTQLHQLRVRKAGLPPLLGPPKTFRNKIPKPLS